MGGEKRGCLGSKQEKKRITTRSRECYGAFCKSPVAQKVQGDKIVIKDEDGVLKITLPKSEKAKAKEIKIKAEKPYTHPSPRLLQS